MVDEAHLYYLESELEERKSEFVSFVDKTRDWFRDMNEIIEKTREKSPDEADTRLHQRIDRIHDKLTDELTKYQDFSTPETPIMPQFRNEQINWALSRSTWLRNSRRGTKNWGVLRPRS